MKLLLKVFEGEILKALNFSDHNNFQFFMSCTEDIFLFNSF